MVKYSTKCSFRIIRALCTIAWLTLLPLIQVYGQLSGSVIERVNTSRFPFSITSYGIQHNLPQNQIADMLKDPLTGELVFSTANGIIKFNGHEFKCFREHVNFRRTIFSKLFHCEYEKKYYGMEDNGKFSILADTPLFVAHVSAADIREPYHVTINKHGLISYNHHIRQKHRQIPTGINAANFIFMLDDSTCLVSAMDKGFMVSLADGKNKQIAEERWVSAARDNSSNSIIVISEKNAYRVRDGALEKMQLDFGEGLPYLKDVEFVEDMVVFSSKKGMFILSPEGFSFFSQKEVFPSNQLTSMHYDKFEGCLFVGTASRGLLKLIRRRCWSEFDDDPEFQYSFGAMAMLPDGRTAVNADRSIVIFPEKREIRVGNPGSYHSGLSLFGDTLAVLDWDGTISAFSLRQQRELFRAHFVKSPVFAVFRDRSGTFWTGTGNGLYRGKDLLQGSRAFDHQIKNKVTTLYEDSKQRLWVGGSEGVFVLDKNRKLEMRFDIGAMTSAQDVRAFYESAAGTIWIGTYGAGLFCYENGRMIALKEKENYLLGSDIFTLARDKLGYILMSSNNGIRVVHEQVLNNYANGKIPYLVPFYIGEHSGIFNPEFNGGFLNNYCSYKDSVFYFPGIQGYVRYVSRTFPQCTDNLRIDQVTLDGTPADMPFRISRKVKFIRFDFFDANFSETQNLFYQYRLQDKNGKGNWSKLQKEPFVTFSNLGPGKYQFQVRAIDGFNPPDPISVSYDFYIPPFFYESFFFYIFLLIGALILLIVHLERKFGKQKKEIARELELKNALTEMQLIAVQSQMNPHFLFNSLNTLVNMISANYLDKAEKFAIDLSQLFRRILEQSGKNFILVQQEIGTLVKYMEIQQARFDFDFSIRCPHELRDRKIPTMLLQPLVENAIIHGIAHLVGEKGKITIDFSAGERGAIQIDIRDNGVGFNKSAALYKGKKKKSMGMEMINRKIALLYDRYNTVVMMEKGNSDHTAQRGAHIKLIIK